MEWFLSQSQLLVDADNNYRDRDYSDNSIDIRMVMIV